MEILTTSFFTIIFTLSIGYICFYKLLPKKDFAILYNQHIVIGASYFLGISILILMGRFFAFFTDNTAISIYVTLIVLGLLILFNVKLLITFFTSYYRNVLIIIVLLCIFAPIILLYWMPYTTLPEDINALIGSLHSGRYVGFSNYITTCNYIPIIGQNTGQSILVSILTTTSSNLPFVYLFSLLLFSIVFYSQFIYGVIASITKHSVLSIIGTFIFMMGNVSLSFAHIMSIDSGSPFALSGYTDTLLGSFIIVFITILMTKFTLTKNTKGLVLILFIILSVSFYTAPQNIVIIYGVTGLLTLLFIFKNKVFKFKVFWSILILSSIININLGGMLTPSKLKESILLPGIQSVENSKKGLKLDPWIPFYVTINSHWEEGNDQTRWFGGQGIFTVHKDNNKHISERIYYYEQTFLMGLRNLFFPIFGLMLLYYTLKRKHNYIQENTLLCNNNVLLLTIISLLVGFTINYPFSLNTYKLELSRFLIPSITLGMLILSILVILIYIHSKNKLRYILLVFIVCSTIGPLTSLTTRVYEHASNYDKLPVNQLFSNGITIRNYMCGGVSKQAKDRKTAVKNIIANGCVPTEQLTDKKTVSIYPDEMKDLHSVGILLTTQGLMYQGDLIVKLSDKYMVKRKLVDLEDNRYNFFKIKKDKYKTININLSQGQAIRLWKKDKNICVVYKYTDKTVYTKNCPKPIN